MSKQYEQRNPGQKNEWRGIFFTTFSGLYAAYANGQIVGTFETLQEAVTQRNIAESEARNDAHNS